MVEGRRGKAEAKILPIQDCCDASVLISQLIDRAKGRRVKADFNLRALSEPQPNSSQLNKGRRKNLTHCVRANFTFCLLPSAFRTE
jgi:hypothetical protein